jgi:tetratricopeptide (TPR) repeat protein
MVCPRCSAPFAKSASICVRCGADLSPSRASTSARPGSLSNGDEPTILGGADGPTPWPSPGPGDATVLRVPEEPTGYFSDIDSSAQTAAGPAGVPAGESGPLTVGQVFGGRYHIIRPLGVGGMGAVYQAWDQELALAVAIKVIRPEIMADPVAAEDIRRRFKRELILARQVTHKSVVRIHDIGQIDGIKYITMAYVSGDDLATILGHEGRLPVPRALHIARAVVSGLAAAHAAGVVHRDLKPANIMVGADDEALIMDFGIARSTLEPVARTGAGARGVSGAPAAPAPGRPDVTTVAAVIGTIEYMAPEQAKGLPVDQRADIYAFGLILYDLLVGRGRPDREHAGSAIAELQTRMQQPPPPARSIVPEIPEALDRVISRCIEPDREKRFQATTELAAELATLDDNGVAIPVRRVFGMRVVAAMVTVVVALLGTTWYFAQTRGGPTEHEPVSVLITDFDNRTNDPVFQGALEQALGLAIEGASFITTYSREDAKKLARQVKPQSPFDVETARVISAREGIKYIVAGSIEARGGRYPISLKAIDPADGHVVSTADGTAADKPSVLKTVGTLAVQIRHALGDTTSRRDSLAAMDPVTTVSLEAIQTYSRGQDLALAGKSDEALKVFEEAIRLDPSLGRAYAQMAVIYGNQKRDRLAEENLQKALKYLDRMTEREKYRTLGSYYLLVAHDYEKAVENYKELVGRYPADNSGHANLAFASLMIGDLESAVTEGRKAIEIYPRNLLQRTNYAMYAMYNSEFKLAIDQSNLVLKDNPRFEYAILTLARATLGLGDIEGAHAAYARLRATSAFGASLAALGEADIAMYLGNNRAALPILEAGIAADLKAGETLDPRPKYVALAEAKLALGDRTGAAAAALKAADGSRQESVLVPAARTLIEVARHDEAEKIAAELENRLQRQTIAYARLIDAEQSVKRNRLASALDALRDSRKRNDSWFVHYALGRTYLQAGQFAQALQEFDWCFKHKGLAGDAFIADSSTLRYFAPVQYWLARAQEGLGNADAAQKNYREFTTLRQSADPSDPFAADAARRLAAPPSR